MDKESERTRKLRLSRTEEHLAIRDKFVQPFYLTGGAFGFTEWDPTERDTWLQDFARTADELDEATAHVLFDTQNWRGYRVGAWMVGYLDWKQFSPVLIDRFKQRRVHAMHGLATGIAMLAVPSAADELCEFLDQGDPDSKGWLPAAAALAELDRVNETNHSYPYLSADGVLKDWQSKYREKYSPPMYPRDLPPIAKTAQLLKAARAQNS